MAGLILSLGLLILLIGGYFRTRGRTAEKRLGVPIQKIRASDVGVEVPLTDQVKKTLVSNKHRSSGTPDYIITGEGEEFVPIEVKSASVREPRESDVYQLLTQCFLSGENGRYIKHGRLVYANRNFNIPYGHRERQKVLQVLAEIRQAERLPLKDIPMKKDHRCKGCVYRTLCQTEPPKGKPRGLQRGFSQAQQG